MRIFVCSFGGGGFLQGGEGLFEKFLDFGVVARFVQAELHGFLFVGAFGIFVAALVELNGVGAAMGGDGLQAELVVFVCAGGGVGFFEHLFADAVEGPVPMLFLDSCFAFFIFSGLLDGELLIAEVGAKALRLTFFVQVDAGFFKNPVAHFGIGGGGEGEGDPLSAFWLWKREPMRLGFGEFAGRMADGRGAEFAAGR